LIVARRIGSSDFTLCATPQFLKTHGTPRVPEDLAQYPTLGMITSSGTGRAQPFRLFSDDAQTELDLHHRLVVKDTNSYLAAGLADLGIMHAPTYTVHEAIKSGRLVALLQDWKTPTFPVSVLYPPNRYLSAKVRAFIDWVVALFESHETLRLK